MQQVQFGVVASSVADYVKINANRYSQGYVQEVNQFQQDINDMRNRQKTRQENTDKATRLFRPYR